MDSVLDRIHTPTDLHGLSIPELEILAKELRQLIIETVSKNGGHLAPNLGTIELTLALYSVFSFPEDKVVWDVGHQAYAHKILTGRRDRFATLRKKGGITGFPNIRESDYDAFGVGHASTSISAALGLAIARNLLHKDGHVIAVIGDGALTGGEAYEALNHAGAMRTPLIVIVNDNHMSIDANVGAMNEYLTRIRLAPEYRKAKRDMTSLLRSIPHIGDTMYKTASHIKDGVRAALVAGNLFEEMGFHYVGPLDGHNIHTLKEIFSQAKESNEPVLLHVSTKKGKGYAPAENAPDRFHGIGKFDIETGECIPSPSAPPTYTKVFSDALISLAEKNRRIVAITAAMPSGTGLKAFGAQYPTRFFDTGIAEEHAMTLAAGMAVSGLHPVIALYSTFAQRAFDQLIHDVCLQKLPVTLALDRAGLVGEDGPTHHGVFDLTYLRMMPNMTIFVPKDEEELRHMLETAVKLTSPTAIRYPRGCGLGVPLTKDFQDIPIGAAEVLQDGKHVALLALGTMVHAAEEAAKILLEQDISCRVVNMRFAKPVDKKEILRSAENTRHIVTLEENVLAGGFGSAVLEVLSDADVSVPVLRIGIPDEFVEQGTRQEQLSCYGMEPAQLAERILHFLKE